MPANAQKLSPPWFWHKSRTMQHLQSADGYLGISAPLPTNRKYSPETRERLQATTAAIAAIPDLLEACLKALTCASIDSNVRTLIVAAPKKANSPC